jgi:hypothetical protein
MHIMAAFAAFLLPRIPADTWAAKRTDQNGKTRDRGDTRGEAWRDIFSLAQTKSVD